MNLFDILFMQKTGKIKPDADLFDILFAKVTGAIERLVTILGNPLSFLAKKAQTAKSTKVTLSPVQDLHGYDNPWPAGGGKNKIDMSALTWTSGIRDDDGEQSSSSASRYSSEWKVLPNTQYTLSGVSSDQAWRIYFLDDNKGWIRRTAAKTASTTEYTFTTDSTCSYIQIQLGNSADLSGMMLELGSQSTSYAPYSNICPISGRTQVTLNGCGKNKHNGEVYIANKYIGSSGNLVASNNYNVYKLNGVSAGECTLSVYDNTEELLNIVLCAQGFDDNNNQTFLNYTTHPSSKSRESITFTVPSGTSYVLYCFRITDYDIQVETGSATAYEPYAESNDVTISFPAVGKNKLPDTNWTIGKYYNKEGELTDSANAILSDFTEVYADTVYTLSGVNIHKSQSGSLKTIVIVVFFDDNKNFLDRFYINNLDNFYTFTTPQTCAFIRASMGDLATEVQLESGSSATNYEPYTNTVYGGTLDVEQGQIVVEQVMLSSNPKGWGQNGTYNTLYVYSNFSDYSSAKRVVCNKYKSVNGASGTAGAYGKGNGTICLRVTSQAPNNTIYIRDDSITDLTVFRNSVPDLQIVYLLKEPRTITLTPEQIQILKGNNTLWIEDGGAVMELSYMD